MSFKKKQDKATDTVKKRIDYRFCVPASSINVEVTMKATRSFIAMTPSPGTRMEGITAHLPDESVARAIAAEFYSRIEEKLMMRDDITQAFIEALAAHGLQPIEH